MPIRIQCPGCEKKLVVNDNLAGKRIRCPACKVPVSVPGSAPAGAGGAGGATRPGPLPVSRPPAGAGRAPTSAPVAPPPDLEALAAESLGLGADEAKPPEPPADGNGQAGGGKPIVFPCYYCEAELTVEAEQAGKQMPCPECGRIIKVPLPKVEKPKDWRDTNKTGPSGAKDNLQPAKPDDAWGTENKKQVSQKALEEAGVAPKKAQLKEPLADRIAWWVKTAFVAGICIALSYGIYRAGADKRAAVRLHDADARIKELKLDEKWNPVVLAELYRGLGEEALRQGKPSEAQDRFMQARQKSLEAKDPKEKLDADFFLIRLATAWVGLGGDAPQVNANERLEWTQDVYKGLQFTVIKLDSDEAKLQGVREVGAELERRGKGELVVGLANSIQPELHKAGAKNPKAVGKAANSNDPVTRAIQAEEQARKGQVAEAIAEQKKGTSSDAPARFEALVAIASWLSLDPADPAKAASAKEARELASKMLEKEVKSPAPWSQLQLLRMVARDDGVDAAKNLLRFKAKAYEQRAKYDLAMIGLEKDLPADPTTVIEDLEKEDRPLAWLEFARSYARKRGTVPRAPDEDLRFLFQITQPAAQVAARNK